MVNTKIIQFWRSGELEVTPLLLLHLGQLWSTLAVRLTRVHSMVQIDLFEIVALPILDKYIPQVPVTMSNVDSIKIIWRQSFSLFHLNTRQNTDQLTHTLAHIGPISVMRWWSCDQGLSNSLPLHVSSHYNLQLPISENFISGTYFTTHTYRNTITRMLFLIQTHTHFPDKPVFFSFQF